MMQMKKEYVSNSWQNQRSGFGNIKLGYASFGCSSLILTIGVKSLVLHVF